MKLKLSSHIWLAIFIMALVLQACGANESVATGIITSTTTPQPPRPANTVTSVPSATAVQFAALMPTRTPNLTATHRAEVWNTSQAVQPVNLTRTPRPTPTPDLAATQHVENWNKDTQKYYELGYLSTKEGEFIEYADFREEWAQLGWYWRWTYEDEPTDFYMSGHLQWSSAYRSADLSGCGFVFAEQENGDHYAVFLDRSKVLFVQTEYYYEPIGTTRGTGRVNFGNPFDEPVEADLTLIVNDAYAYVLVDGEAVGEYTLSQSKMLTGKVGLALLSGTNKDFGTRCEITDLHLWIPND